MNNLSINERLVKGKTNSVSATELAFELRFTIQQVENIFSTIEVEEVILVKDEIGEGTVAAKDEGPK